MSNMLRIHLKTVSDYSSIIICHANFLTWTDVYSSLLWDLIRWSRPSHITATLFIVPFILISLGSDLGSSYVAKATDFYWVMSFPVGTGLPVRGFASHSSACRACTDILVWQSNKSWHGTIMLFGASHRSPGILQIGFVGTDVLPSCSAVVEFNVWQLGFNGYKKGPGEL